MSTLEWIISVGAFPENCEDITVTANLEAASLC
jgi:hypothetical protein